MKKKRKISEKMPAGSGSGKILRKRTHFRIAISTVRRYITGAISVLTFNQKDG